MGLSELWRHGTHEPWVLTSQFERALRRARGFASGLLLDAGCGRKPYEPLYSGLVTRHIGLDLPPDGSMAAGNVAGLREDVRGDLHALPFQAAVFDTVLSTHVLVHLAEPGQAMKEMSRVLKPGGHLILGDRQMWHVYTPRDYYRFTASGLSHLAQQQGLDVMAILPVGGFLGRTGAKLVYALQRLNPRPLRWLTEVPVGLAVVITQAVFYALDRLLPTPDDVVFNILVARKR